MTLSERPSTRSRSRRLKLCRRRTTSIVQLEGALQLIRQHKTQRATAMLGNVQEQLHGGLHELRDTLHALRTPGVTDGGLTHMLQRLADAFTIPEHAKISTQLPAALPSCLSRDQCLTIYRAAQEALTNTAKHAQAQNVWIALDSRSDKLILAVVGEAENGQKAISLYAELRPDVVLMDVQMPEMNGVEATRRILTQDPEAKILVLTTFDNDESTNGSRRFCI